MNHGDTCLTESGAVRVLAGALRGSEAEAVRDHLDGCALCARLIAEASRDTETEGTRWSERIRPRVLLPGLLLAGRYDILRLLGIGAMGEVHLAEDRLLGEVVAVKTLNAKLAGNCEALARLKLEVATAHRVTHPNVCRIFDFGADRSEEGEGEVVFLTMEYLPGTTLAERLRARGRLSTSEALPLLIQLAEGLAAAHTARVVHRDLKAENIMLVASSVGPFRAVITDFGLAGSILDGGGVDLERKSGFSGTLAYAAPERLAGGAATPASDVYSFGVLAYEMLTGRLSPEPLSVALCVLPARWQRFIGQVVHPDPRHRLNDGAALVLALRTLSAVRSRPVKTWASIVVAAACLGIVFPIVKSPSPLKSKAGPSSPERESPPPNLALARASVPEHPSPSSRLQPVSRTTQRPRRDSGRPTARASGQPPVGETSSDLLREVHFRERARAPVDEAAFLPDPFLVDPFKGNAHRTSQR